jgi:hypothetical protein
MMDKTIMDIVTMAIAVSAVFLILLVLVIIFYNIEIIIKTLRNNMIRRTLRSLSPGAIIPRKIRFEASGEEYAAIAATVYMYNNELHDEENAIITIEKSTRTWTPWSDKYFNMNTYFMKRHR